MTPLCKLEHLFSQSTEQLLLSGGDSRLSLDQQTKLNKYGCASQPDNALITFGSSTGSTISEQSFAAAKALHQRLCQQKNSYSAASLYRQELERIRLELNHLCNFSTQTQIATIFAASGTDLHLIYAQLIASNSSRPLHIIVMDSCETGSGIESAVSGKHFSGNTALGKTVNAFEPISDSHAIEVTNIKIRDRHGVKRPLTIIDAEVDNVVQHAVANQQRVLLIMIDVSKTGLIAPGPNYVAMLQKKHAAQVDVLVDACQFRISNDTLNAYLNLGCMVALTGSKFLTGPIFSGILYVPPNLIPRLSQQKLPASLADYSAQAEWPEHWMATRQLSDTVNWGLLLRLEATLAELRAFRAIPESRVSTFLNEFAIAVQEALQRSPHFFLMSEKKLDRSPIYTESSWDQIPTIFPFLLQHTAEKPLTRDQTQLIYKQLQLPIPLIANDTPPAAFAHLRCQLGQPVLCGNRHGIDVSALRICASSRLISEACEQGEIKWNPLSSQKVIQRVLITLEKAEFLIKRLAA